MAKNLNSFYEYTAEPGKTYPKDVDGSSFLFSLGNNSINQQAPGFCYCTGGACYNPAGYDSDIPRYVWTVPTGVTQATFHIWGSGGWGAGSYHCQQGVPGGSGAYAVKSLTVTPGDQYTLCLGDMIDNGTQTTYNCAIPTNEACGPTDINHGVRGPKAYVTGTGLTNFCVEGGNPGVVMGEAWTSKQYKICSDGTLDYFRCYQNIYVCDLVGSTEDSDNNRYHRACYYGADYGARGLQGYVQANCCSNTCNGAGEWCGIKHFIPFSGYQPDFAYGWAPSLQGGWVKQLHCSIVMGPFTAKANRSINSKTPYMGATCWTKPHKWGAGGISATTCGGTVCCGGAGGPNAIRVIYKQKV